MADYLLDTNHASYLFGGSQALRERIQSAVASGHRFGISMTVPGELFYAAYASQRRDQNLQALRRFMDDVFLWPFDAAAAEEFGHIQAEQKAKGRPIPPTDAQIAAVARLRGLTILTADQHFREVGSLAVENWLV